MIDGTVQYLLPSRNEAVVRYLDPCGCPLYFHAPLGDLREGDKVEIIISKKDD